MGHKDREEHNRYQRERGLAFLNRGLCRYCGKGPHAPDRVGCGACLARITAKAMRRYERDRKAVFDYYGRRCACCGENQPLFLTIDHANDDGPAHRRDVVKSKSLYSWLVYNGFPAGFQTLCFNCNCGRYRNGGVCPHKLKGAS